MSKNIIAIVVMIIVIIVLLTSFYLVTANNTGDYECILKPSTEELEFNQRMAKWHANRGEVYEPSKTVFTLLNVRLMETVVTFPSALNQQIELGRKGFHTFKGHMFGRPYTLNIADLNNTILRDNRGALEMICTEIY